MKTTYKEQLHTTAHGAHSTRKAAPGAKKPRNSPSPVLGISTSTSTRPPTPAPLLVNQSLPSSPGAEKAAAFAAPSAFPLSPAVASRKAMGASVCLGWDLGTWRGDVPATSFKDWAFEARCHCHADVGLTVLNPVALERKTCFGFASKPSRSHRVAVDYHELWQEAANIENVFRSS